MVRQRKLRNKLGKAVLVQNNDRPAIKSDQVLLAKLSERRTDRLSAAADEIGQLLMGELRTDADTGLVGDSMIIAQFQQEMGQTGRDSPEYQILNAIVKFSEASADELGELQGHVRMLAQVALEIFSPDHADQGIV